MTISASARATVAAVLTTFTAVCAFAAFMLAATLVIAGIAK